MCGVLAIFCKNLPKNIEKIIDSEKCQSQRGPDSTKTIIDSRGVYIFHRLSINGTTENGNQPMVSDSRLMMCNGEIYNHSDLQKSYNLLCTSKSDCEVILRLYEYFTKRMSNEQAFIQTVKKLYGVFAIVLVDQDTVFFARDRIGIRPLYIGLTDENSLAVASTPNALASYCTRIIPCPPGAVFTHNKASRTSVEMKIIHVDELVIPQDRIQDGENKLRNQLIEAVKCRLMSDRPLGCLLSGGLDSSLITSILVKFLGGKNVRTYSIGMKGSTDLFYARKVADFLGTDHHEVIFTPEEGFSIIPEVIRTLASYDITTVRASVGMYLLAEYIAKTSQDKVIFSGEGSDEILQGYLYFHNSPSPKDGEEESLRLMKNLHLYDVLRLDRCISANGLEPRVPFLDRRFVDVVLSLPASEKTPRVVDGKKYEKYILRKAFEGYLPNDVLWRTKEAFSDGVSSKEKSWFQYIQEMVEHKISDEFFNETFPSKEAQYYKLIFDKFFPSYELKIDYWLPRWCGNIKDPSARLLKIYDS